VGCRKVQYGEVWYEKIVTEQGMYRVVHDYDCWHDTPCFFKSEPKENFVKHKHDVFCGCIDREVVEEYNMISQFNIAKARLTEPKELVEMYDPSERIDVLYYVYDNDKKEFVELDEPIIEGYYGDY
jgi:hypothetical protein